MSGEELNVQNVQLTTEQRAVVTRMREEHKTDAEIWTYLGIKPEEAKDKGTAIQRESNPTPKPDAAQNLGAQRQAQEIAQQKAAAQQVQAPATQAAPAAQAAPATQTATETAQKEKPKELSPLEKAVINTPDHVMTKDEAKARKNELSSLFQTGCMYTEDQIQEAKQNHTYTPEQIAKLKENCEKTAANSEKIVQGWEDALVNKFTWTKEKEADLRKQWEANPDNMGADYKLPEAGKDMQLSTQKKSEEDEYIASLKRESARDAKLLFKLDKNGNIRKDENGKPLGTKLLYEKEDTMNKKLKSLPETMVAAAQQDAEGAEKILREANKFLKLSPKEADRIAERIVQNEQAENRVKHTRVFLDEASYNKAKQENPEQRNVLLSKESIKILEDKRWDEAFADRKREVDSLGHQTGKLTNFGTEINYETLKKIGKEVAGEDFKLDLDEDVNEAKSIYKTEKDAQKMKEHKLSHKEAKNYRKLFEELGYDTEKDKTNLKRLGAIAQDTGTGALLGAGVGALVGASDIAKNILTYAGMVTGNVSGVVTGTVTGTVHGTVSGTASGVANGVAHTTIQGIASQTITGDYSGTVSGTATGIANFQENFVSNYFDNGVKVGQQTSVVNKSVNVPVQYSAPYSGTYTRDVNIPYTRDVDIPFSQKVDVNYSKEYSQDYSQNYSKEYSQDYQQNYSGHVSRGKRIKAGAIEGGSGGAVAGFFNGVRRAIGINDLKNIPTENVLHGQTVENFVKNKDYASLDGKRENQVLAYTMFNKWGLSNDELVTASQDALSDNSTRMTQRELAKTFASAAKMHNEKVNQSMEPDTPAPTPTPINPNKPPVVPVDNNPNPDNENICRATAEKGEAAPKLDLGGKLLYDAIAKVYGIKDPVLLRKAIGVVKQNAGIADRRTNTGIRYLPLVDIEIDGQTLSPKNVSRQNIKNIDKYDTNAKTIIKHTSPSGVVTYTCGESPTRYGSYEEAQAAAAKYNREHTPPQQ